MLTHILMQVRVAHCRAQKAAQLVIGRRKSDEVLAVGMHYLRGHPLLRMRPALDDEPLGDNDGHQQRAMR